MNHAQSRLKVLLKTKGTGQTMSKALSFEDCSDIKSLSTSPDINPFTFATLFTALYMLDRNKAEEDLLNTLKKQSISAYILSNSNSPFSNLVQKLIHFKNLTPNEIKMFCKLVFGPEFDGIQAAPDLLNPDSMSSFRGLYSEYLDLACDHLDCAEEYISIIPRRYRSLRLSCLLPVVIGRRTIALLRGGNVLTPGGPIKIGRRSIGLILLQCKLAVRSKWYEKRLLSAGRLVSTRE